ncbi:cytochrome P450 [Cyathus striatus]|nr:cytochrome P450 [Cyathus striatus]
MPYVIGLQAASTAFISAGWVATQLTLSVAIIIFILFITSSLQKDGVDELPSISGIQLLAIFPFFCRRYDFLNWGFHVTGQSIFQFPLLRNKVIVVSGKGAHEAFFTAKGLDLTEGFKILSGAIPMVHGMTSDLQTKQVVLIHRCLANVQKNTPLSELIPKILEGWGESGTFDPFENIYELIFQMTIQSLTCKEIADNPLLVAQLKKLYDTLDWGTTPATMLLDFGDEKLVVIGFIMGLLIAGTRVTGTTASWLITFLAGHPEWYLKVAQEAESLLASNRLYKSGSSLLSQHASIPLEVWEQNMPVLEAIIQETTHVAQPHTAMRRNLGPEFFINDKIIPTGAYVIYPFSDIHLDPEVYPDSWKFDLGRKESIDTLFRYVCWGRGSTWCLGTHLAKVELKLITVMYVLGFQHSMVD